MTDKKRNENVGLELLELEDEMLLDTPLDRGTTSVVDHAEKLLCDSKRSSSRKGPKKMAWLSEVRTLLIQPKQQTVYKEVL